VFGQTASIVIPWKTLLSSGSCGTSSGSLGHEITQVGNVTFALFIMMTL